MSKQERFLFKDEVWITEQDNLFASWWKENEPERKWKYNTEDGWYQSWDGKECTTPEIDTVYSNYKNLKGNIDELHRLQNIVENKEAFINSLPKLERL